MIRRTLLTLIIFGAAASAIAAVKPSVVQITYKPANLTLVYKNSPFPVIGPITVEECAKEDCSDVQS